MKIKRKKNRYALKEKKINREALSYEDMPLEDYEQNERKITLEGVKKLLKVVVILGVCALLILIVVNWENISLEKRIDWVQGEMFGTGTGDGYPCPINGTNVSNGNIMLMGEKLVIASDTSFSVLNSSAKELYNKQHSYSNPAINTGKNRAILYNIGGVGFSIESKSGTVANKTVEEKIRYADINDDGTYALLTESAGFLSRATIYTSLNEKRYIYSFADYYANIISLNNDNKTAAVSGFSSVEGGLESAVYIIDFSSETPRNIYRFTDEFILGIKYLENDNIAVVGDTAAYVIDPDNDKVIKYDYKKLSLTDFYIDPESGIIVSLSTSGDGNRCKITAINIEGEVCGDFVTSHKILSVSCAEDKISYLSGGTAYYYDNTGKLIGAFGAGNDAGKIIMVNQKMAYVMGINEIRQISFT